MELREIGKETLKKVLTINNNIIIIERNIFLASGDNIELYKQYLYQVISDIRNGTSLKQILNNIKNNKIGWNHPTFNEVTKKQDEQDDYICNPFLVEEGVITCSCGSKRTLSFSKQIRSSDEGTSVIVNCIDCKKHWIISG